MVNRLQSETNNLARARLLTDLRSELIAMPTSAASAVIFRLLDSKVDAATGQSFKIGPDGQLVAAPTLRTCLLECLAQVDPSGAATYARTILASPDSPDEWALALRSLAKGDSSPDGRALLEQQTGDLLRNTTWQRDPSAGYLEAFDATVFLGGTRLVPDLGELLRKDDNPAVAHAAYLALDRKVINDPVNMLEYLEKNPELMQGREATRANYFARADVSDPEQRRIVETYLLSPSVKPAELGKFAALYPSANYMISYNLLTPTFTLDHATLVRRDTAALDVVNQWLAEPRFASLRPQLQIVKLRLEEFARQTKGP